MPSVWGFLALPAALLIGFAFAAMGRAATSFMRSWQDFDLVNMISLPLFLFLFLFSATFYPLDVYPAFLQTIARFSPLYHGVGLIRSLTLRGFDLSLIGHVTFLVAMGMVGPAVTSRRLGQLLLQ